MLIYRASLLGTGLLFTCMEDTASLVQYLTYMEGTAVSVQCFTCLEGSVTSVQYFTYLEGTASSVQYFTYLEGTATSLQYFTCLESTTSSVQYFTCLESTASSVQYLHAWRVLLLRYRILCCYWRLEDGSSLLVFGGRRTDQELSGGYVPCTIVDSLIF